MRKLALLVMLFSPIIGRAQTDAYNNWCMKGNQPVVTQGIASVSVAQVTLTSCIVTVNLTGTVNLATIYRDGSNTALANPFSTSIESSDGSFFFWAAVSSHYDVSFTGIAVCVPLVAGCPSNGQQTYTVTYSDVVLGRGSGGGGGGGGSGTVTSVATGAGLTGGPCVVTCTISIATGAVTNAMLANPSVTINTSGGLTGGGALPLGGTLNIAGNGASGIVGTCGTAKALGIYSSTGTTIGCDSTLTESGAQILYVQIGTSLLPAYSFSSAPDSGIFAKLTSLTFPISTATRTSNVSTLTMVSLPTGADAFYVGGGIHVAGVTGDTSFNGNYTVTGVTGSTITYSQALGDSVAGTGGTLTPWTTGVGSYQVSLNRILSNSNPASPTGFLRLGATDQINYYCPSGSTLNGTTGCNGFSGQGSTGPALVGDGQGVQFNGPGSFPGTVLDFTPGTAMTPCAINTHSCWGVSNDGNFYIAPNGGSPVRVGTVLPAAVVTSVTLNNLADANTAPTVTGFGTSPSVVNNNGTVAFEINVGTGGAATSGTVTFPSAAHHWVVRCDDITTQSATVFVTKQTGGTATTAIVGNFNTSGAAAAWVASDILYCQARAE